MAGAGGGDEAADVAERGVEREADRDGLPEQVRERDGDPERVEAAGEGEAGVEERAVAGREVEAVADQEVVRGVADPGEVLELVGGEEAVGS